MPQPPIPLAEMQPSLLSPWLSAPVLLSRLKIAIASLPEEAT
jgi:hypothetical protein